MNFHSMAAAVMWLSTTNIGYRLGPKIPTLAAPVAGHIGRGADSDGKSSNHTESRFKWLINNKLDTATRLTAHSSQQSRRQQTVCCDVKPNNGRDLYMLRSALQLAEPQLAEPNSVSSVPVPSDISRPCLGQVAAARAARDVSKKLEGAMDACSKGGVPAIVQQSLQSSLDQQQLLVTWLESEVQQEAPSSTSPEGISASCTADAAASWASDENSSTAVDCTFAGSAHTAAGSAPTAASSANSRASNSMSRPGSVASPLEVACVKSLAEGLLGPPKAPASSVDDATPPKAIWAGVAATRGKKKSMEDYHALHYLHPQLGVQHITQCSDTSSSTFLAGVYDGHGGTHTAAYAAAQLPHLLQQELLSSSSKQGTVTQQQVFTEVFHQLDRSWQTFGHHSKSGSTAVTAMINKKNLVVANAGDSVAVLARGGSSRRLTQSHKLSHPPELERITAVGGSTIRDRVGNRRLMQSPLRLQPYVPPMTLAVTRGFGDFGFKGVGGDFVIPTPHVNELQLTGDDEVLLLVSDGITDVMEDDVMMEVAVNAISKARNATTDGSQLSSAAASAVKNAALAAGAWDNLTVVAILMDWK